PLPSSMYPLTPVSDCNPYDVVEVPVAAGTPQELEGFSTSPEFDLPPSWGSDTATDGTHAYWIGVWGVGALNATRDGRGSWGCPEGALGRTCPLVDLAATRIALDTTYLYVFDQSGSIWRTFK